MHAPRSRKPEPPPTGWVWGAPIEASAAVLELIASENLELVEFQARALLDSTMSFAIRELAANIGVAPEHLGHTIWTACTHLDRLERHRRKWRAPAEVLSSSFNLAALLYVCRARLKRVSRATRRQKLKKILRRLDQAEQESRTRAWIDDFIGSPPARPVEAGEDAR